MSSEFRYETSDFAYCRRNGLSRDRHEFSLNHKDKTYSGTHQTFYPISGSWLQVKRTKREAGNSPPPSSEVRNAWSFASTLPWCGA
jgi:hypothetical protein